MERLDRFKGCLLGGAAGDALGYQVEFMSAGGIFRQFGKGGITEYVLESGKALISDDTQMTMFTANGLLRADGLTPDTPDYWTAIAAAYRAWFHTQSGRYGDGKGERGFWLNNVRQLYSRRAPGNTCMSAILQGARGTIEEPVNNSCGCGGVMRVAPIGLYFAMKSGADVLLADRIGAEAAAITHGHELGYISSAMLVHIVFCLIWQPEMTIRAAVEDSIGAMKKLFPDAVHLPQQIELVEQAIALTESGLTDLEAITQLGGGWTGHDALAIAVYCAVKYPDDFDRAMIAAVNHSGDSDSTGAIAGNILGAKLGMAGIPEKYLTHLELKDVLLELAEDLYAGVNTPASADPLWVEKYVLATYTPELDDDSLSGYGDI